VIFTRGRQSTVLKPTDMTIHWKALEEHFLMVPLVLGSSKSTDVTIHWKAFEEHFLMVPLVFQFNLFLGVFEGKMHFQKNLGPYSVKR
jgi:hypothetical protein